MAKKTIRRRVYNKPRQTHRNPCDCHHIFFTRRRWSVGRLKTLREHYYTKAYIPRDTLHSMIHSEIAYVPEPSGSSVAFVLKQLEMLENYHAISPDDSLEKKLKVFIALFDCLEELTADSLRVQLKIVRDFYKKPS